MKKRIFLSMILAAVMLAALLAGCGSGGSAGVPAFQADGGVSARGSLCPEHGSQSPAVPGGADPPVQRAVRVRDRVCGADLLRGDRRAPAYEAAF